jgi:hypothetical protein
MMAVSEQRAGAVERYLSTALPGPCVPWRDASFAVLGLEVTGPDQEYDQIGSVAWIPVERGRAIIGTASETSVRPARLQESLDPILDALTGRVLVAHAAPVHVGFLSAAFELPGSVPEGPRAGYGHARGLASRAGCGGGRSTPGGAGYGAGFVDRCRGHGTSGTVRTERAEKP